MNFPLINYDILYSPEPKKEPQKPRPLYQTPLTSSSSLSNPFKDKPLNFLKSPVSNAKPQYSSEFSTNKPLISNNLAATSINSIVGKAAIKGGNEKTVNSGNNFECFKVFARIRPLNSKEIAMHSQSRKTNFTKTVIRVDENSVKLFPLEYQINIGREEKIYNFDAVFDENDCNEAIFKKTMLSPVENLLNGYNSSILAYGMTGTGKTHTMFGDIYCHVDGKEPEPGLIILTVKDIFWKIEILINENRNLEFKIRLSYLEIYNEQVKDLLVDNSENLMILEDQVKGVVIPDLTEIQLNTPTEIIKLIDQGNGRRTMASTSSNQFSSRSHAILILSIEKRNLAEPNQIIFAKFCLVDLAGSERALISDVKGVRMTEGANINKSLLALGNCINILSDSNKKGAFVPYRDSKLTRLLKESLGGNTKTIMIACLSPSNLSYEETLNTLKYASRAKNIKRKINKNIREIEDVTEYKGIIETLKNEIDNLKTQLLQKTHSNPTNFENSEEESARNSRMAPPRNSEANVELDGKLEGISQKILCNLEENWEIKQSVIELKNLKVSNEMALQEKKRRLDVLRHENPMFLNMTSTTQWPSVYYSDPLDGERKRTEIENLDRDIRALEETMGNNDRILTQMESQMMRTREKRDRLHEDMCKIHDRNNHKLVADLKSACDILNKEKQDLQTLNSEMRRKEMDLVRMHEQKEATIKEMQKTIDFMKKKLEEKDKIIEENNIIIKNLSNNNLELIKSSLAKHKNYRSNTTENKINLKFKSNSKKPDRIEEFPKNTSGIRQYFKGKSAGNFTNTKSYQKSKDYQGQKNSNENNGYTEAGGVVSNRSNCDNNGNRKILDKLSECSSLTRFEAGNADLYKNSLVLPTEESSPRLIIQKGRKASIEVAEDVECTKKIVENLSEVSSILQEESQNFSVSDQIMMESLEKNAYPQKEPDNKSGKTPITIGNFSKPLQNQPPVDKFSQLFTPVIQKPPSETPNHYPFNPQGNPPSQQKALNPETKEKDNERNEVRNNKPFDNPFKTMNSNSQTTLFPSYDYQLYLFKDRIQKGFEALRQGTCGKEALSKEVLDMILENNKSTFVLDDYHNMMFHELKEYYYSGVPKGSELSRSFLEKNRSSSANSVTERKEPTYKTNIKLFPNKAVNIPNNGSELRTSTEKGFYDSLDKSKKSQPFHYIKYGSINLQEVGNPPNVQEKSLSQFQKKNDSIHTNKSEEKGIPWDELTRKGREKEYQTASEGQNLPTKPIIQDQATPYYNNPYTPKPAEENRTSSIAPKFGYSQGHNDISEKRNLGSPSNFKSNNNAGFNFKKYTIKK